MTLSRRGALRPSAATVAVHAVLVASALIVPAATAAPSAAPSAAPAPAAPASVISTDAIGDLRVENSFVSDVGWVKPGDTYPSRILLTNDGAAPATGATVTVSAPRGAVFTDAAGPGTHPVTPDEVVWTPGPVAPGATIALILESRAATLAQEPTLVWRDISSTADLAVGGDEVTVTSHGPRVIPPGETYETARYGDRPFPVVPVAYTDKDYRDTHERDLDTVINDPEFPGSTFNLFQEMSLGQLYPQGTVPSTGKGTVPFAPGEAGYDFTKTQVPPDTCTGVTFGDSPASPIGTPLYPNRIEDDVYQLPGQMQWYGADSGGTGIAGPGQIDSGCGSPGKLVRDAAVIADPDIDYSDYDTDKDGVVDFFMAVFAGCGGNGASQAPPVFCEFADEVPGDNVWPHSSSLEFYYSDADTGLPGYTTDDQLKDLEGRPLWYTDDTYSTMTTDDTGDALKVFVRVGPYNVNPETAIDKASVISHEYGHSLGLPDFYSNDGTRETYGDWNLMATDKSQHMDIFSRQELGWVIPQVLEAGTTPTVGDWKDSKEDIDTITWQTADGTPYTLTEGVDGRVQNSEAYVAKLPGRTLLDPSVFDSGEGASKVHTWWSRSGNDFGCAPGAGHNLDLSIPELAAIDPASKVTLTFKSRWDIEWDYDYGFVLTTVDQGKNYVSQESERGYTTSNTDPTEGNPYQNGCQAKFDNGITGTSGSYEAGTEALDRKLDEYPAAVFLEDEYDISELAGEALGALRFSYATDPGLARPGWFVDDLTVTVTEPGQPARDVMVTDFEDSGDPSDPRIYNGGCHKEFQVAQKCTPGWSYVAAGAEAPLDHAYYLEMRDRSGFDLDGKGQIDRTPIGFGAGLSLVYTDEAHGYGNVGVDDPPAQSPLDSVPQPGNSAPNLDDAAFRADPDSRSAFSDSGEGHTDNYEDPSSPSGNWEFRYDCLTFDVQSMSGETEGPATADGDLTGTVGFDMGAGCGEFDYGYGDVEPPDPNTAPVAAATASPDEVEEGEEVEFDATGTTDAETPGDLDYSWDFGDDEDPKDATGPVVTHSYDEEGTYTATVTVTDPQGAVDTASVEVTVTPAPVDEQDPDARMRVKPDRPFNDRTVVLKGKRSTDDRTASKDLVYEWDFGDGGERVDATGRKVETRFRQPGVRWVRLTVTDEAGNSSTVQQRVRVKRFVDCQANRVVLSGSWRVVRGGNARDGSYCDNRARGRGADVARLDFRGGRLSVVFGRSADGGKAKVWIDGERQPNLSFANRKQRVKVDHTRRYQGLGRGEHTVRIKVVRGEAYLDGFVLRK